jgi:hypothetical protein
VADNVSRGVLLVVLAVVVGIYHHRRRPEPVVRKANDQAIARCWERLKRSHPATELLATDPEDAADWGAKAAWP